MYLSADEVAKKTRTSGSKRICFRFSVLDIVVFRLAI